MWEKLLEDKFIDCLGGFIVFFTIVNFVITQKLGYEISKGFQRLETDIIGLRFNFLDNRWKKLLQYLLGIGNEQFCIFCHLLEDLKEASSEFVKSLVVFGKFTVLKEVCESLNHI